jgi:hypothetical protein
MSFWPAAHPGISSAGPTSGRSLPGHVVHGRSALAGVLGGLAWQYAGGPT